MILSSIRDKGKCPCHRCLVTFDQISGLGTVSDMQRREALVRVDDTVKRNKVDAARALIYDQNRAVDSMGVEELLKDQSLAPIAVSVAITRNFIYTDGDVLERLLAEACTAGLRHLLVACG